MSSSLYTLMVLSASAVIKRLSEWSNTQENIPDSLSREPGCTAAWIRWKLYPVLQSHRWIVPLSAEQGRGEGQTDVKRCYKGYSEFLRSKKKCKPPETRTPSEFTARVLMMALCPDRFWIKFPSGNFHCLMLSGDPEANVYLHKEKGVTAPRANQSCILITGFTNMSG